MVQFGSGLEEMRIPHVTSLTHMSPAPESVITGALLLLLQGHVTVERNAPLPLLLQPGWGVGGQLA